MLLKPYLGFRGCFHILCPLFLPFFFCLFPSWLPLSLSSLINLPLNLSTSIPPVFFTTANLRSVLSFLDRKKQFLLCSSSCVSFDVSFFMSKDFFSVPLPFTLLSFPLQAPCHILHMPFTEPLSVKLSFSSAPFTHSSDPAKTQTRVPHPNPTSSSQTTVSPKNCTATPRSHS